MIDAAVLCFVISISDGDTLKVRCDQQTMTIRVAEIDAPERRQPFGNRSKQNLAALCFQTLAKIQPQKTDRYGRTVARVECNGQDVSYAQLHAGMAWVYSKYSMDPSLEPVESAARSSRRGLWSDEQPIQPWVWRKAGK